MFQQHGRYLVSRSSTKTSAKSKIRTYQSLSSLVGLISAGPAQDGLQISATLTTTESNVPELAAQLQAHVSSMYSHLDQGVEVSCMSQSLPSLFRQAGGYRRQLTLTPTGVIDEETADDPALTEIIRAHAREVTEFVQQGMPAMMQHMMRGAA